MLDSNRIFIANVDYTFCGPNPIGTDYHPFDDAVWVSFQYATIHIRTGVTLISIAYKELATLVWLFCQQFPFQSCGKAASTAAAQSRTLDLFHHPSGVALGKYFVQDRISTSFDVIINADRIYLLIPSKKSTNLLIEERYIILAFHWLAGFRIREKNISKHFVPCCGLDNTFHLFEADFRVKDPAGLDKYRGFHLAESVASGNA